MTVTAEPIAVVYARPSIERGDTSLAHLTEREKVWTIDGILLGTSLCRIYASWLPTGLPAAPEVTCKVCWLEAGFDMRVYMVREPR